ncbi:hypothetical protein [Celeribacter sp.]|uniref:hypothetical protein n=1 Tax=Celeribacter sp. TaxID=1890673 RepID=UPI003A944D50
MTRKIKTPALAAPKPVAIPSVIPSRNPFHQVHAKGQEKGFAKKIKPIPMPGKSRGRG